MSPLILPSATATRSELGKIDFDGADEGVIIGVQFERDAAHRPMRSMPKLASV